jgi:cellulose synthase/poly-beta-1,6-N-acetylglucosamine synthase-like glycosyltransferase
MISITDSVDFLSAMPAESLALLFWLTLTLEVPRYAFGMAALLFIRPWRWITRERHFVRRMKVSLLVPGHNEAASIENCLISLREQSYNDYELIVVDDGSTDGMSDIVQRLEAQGFVTRSARCRLRGGKSSAINLGARLATGDIIFVLDSDCSFDRYAIEEMLKPFSDPRVGAVSGSVLVRNAADSITARLQAIEYMVSISLGRSVMDMFGQVTCVSGAFGAFRREAWDDIGGMDVGSGEDFDATIRLRRRGWKVAFAHASICYTDVPDTLYGLMRQRFRWERDSIWIRYRKHYRNMLPFSPEFRWSEAFHQLDFLFFHVFLAVAFPIYLVWLFLEFGPGALLISISVILVLSTLDIFAFLIAVVLMRRWEDLKLLPVLPIYGAFNSYVMRFVRLFAYLDEWIFSNSLNDDYVPAKVRAWGYWR